MDHAVNFLTAEHIKEAEQRIRGKIPVTSCRFSYKLSNRFGVNLWLKYENTLTTGAFKERGALNKLLQLTDAERQAGVIAASAGNHAQGVAYHAGLLDIPATIVMPNGTPLTKIEQTKRFGAEVVLSGETFDQAYTNMLELQKQKGFTLIHPFNDYDVIAGQGTIGLEILDQVPELDALIIPIGGGGLMAGIAVAAKSIKPDIKIYGVQSVLYPHFYNRFHRFKTPPSDRPSIAEGIAVNNPGDLTYATASNLIEEIFLVDEAHIETAITLLATEEKSVAEGAGAAGLATIIANSVQFQGKNVGLIVCGGNIDSRLLSTVLTRSLFREERLFTVKIAINDRPGFLADIADLIGQNGGNIIDVDHNRYDLGMPAKEATLSIVIEARDSHHAHALRSALVTAGFHLRG